MDKLTFNALILFISLCFCWQTAVAESSSTDTNDAPVSQESVVDINSADAETLAKILNGIGLKKAEAIVEYRTTYGAFVTIEELADVKGIGIKTVDRNKSKIRIN